MRKQVNMNSSYSQQDTWTSSSVFVRCKLCSEEFTPSASRSEDITSSSMGRASRIVSEIDVSMNIAGVEIREHLAAPNSLSHLMKANQTARMTVEPTT